MLVKIKIFTPIAFAAISFIILLIMFISEPSGENFFQMLLFMVPFFVVYLVDYILHPVIRIIFLIIGILMNIGLLTFLASNIVGIELLVGVVLTISNLLSCVTAMIFSEDIFHYWLRKHVGNRSFES